MEKLRIHRILPVSAVIVCIAGLVAAWIGISDRKLQIKVEGSEIFLPVGREVSADTLPVRVEPASGTTLYFYHGGELTETFTPDSIGETAVTVVAVDQRGGRAEASFTAICMNAPDISGTKEIYAAEGAEIEYLSGIASRDAEDGELTGSLQVTVDEQAGNRSDGQVTYSVMDSDGMLTSSTVNIHILPADQLQQMIFTRQINCRDHLIFGAEKPYDTGCSEEEALEDNLEFIRPALVQLYHSTEESTVMGSGFIVEITADKIYMVTNRHVIHDYDQWEVFFFDGTEVTGRKLGISEEFDVGVAEVDTGDLPESLLSQLMTVHIDTELWNERYGTAFEAGYIVLDQAGQEKSRMTGNIIRTLSDFSYGNNQLTLLDMELNRGDSGSAIVDAYGNLMSMVYGTSHEADQSTKYWGVPLDAIIMCYEQITGRTLDAAK